MSSEPAWSEPELPAPPPPRERYLGLFSAATPSGQVAEARSRAFLACRSGLQQPQWSVLRFWWGSPQIILRSVIFLIKFAKGPSAPRPGPRRARAAGRLESLRGTGTSGFPLSRDA